MSKMAAARMKECEEEEEDACLTESEDDLSVREVLAKTNSKKGGKKKNKRTEEEDESEEEEECVENGNSTDDSELEDFVPETRSPRYSIIDMTAYTERSKVSVRSAKDHGAKKPAPSSSKADEESSDEEEEEGDSEATQSDDFKVDYPGYREILREQLTSRDREDTALRSYEATVSSNSKGGGAGCSDRSYPFLDEDTDEEQEEEVQQQPKQQQQQPKVSFAPEEVEDEGELTDEGSLDKSSLDGEDDDTRASDLEVTMKDYYQIRKQTQPRSENDMTEYLLQLNQVFFSYRKLEDKQKILLRVNRWRAW